MSPTVWEKRWPTHLQNQANFQKLWNITAPFKMCVGGGGGAPNLPDGGEPASQRALSVNSEAQLWSWCLALIPSCGVGETKSYFGYDSLFCFVFGFGRKSLASCFGFVHQYSTKEMKNFRWLVPPSLHPWWCCWIIPPSEPRLPISIIGKGCHHPEADNLLEFQWRSKFNTQFFWYRVSSVHGLTQSNFNGTGEDKKQKQKYHQITGFF